MKWLGLTHLWRRSFAIVLPELPLFQNPSCFSEFFEVSWSCRTCILHHYMSFMMLLQGIRTYLFHFFLRRLLITIHLMSLNISYLSIHFEYFQVLGLTDGINPHFRRTRRIFSTCLHVYTGSPKDHNSFMIVVNLAHIFWMVSPFSFWSFHIVYLECLPLIPWLHLFLHELSRDSPRYFWHTVIHFSTIPHTSNFLAF